MPKLTHVIKQLPWQGRVYNEMRRFNVLTKGRRCGGTAFAEDWAIEAMLGGKRVGWFFDTYKRLAEVWRELIFALKPILKRVNTQEHRIELATDGILEFWSCESRLTCKGRKYHRVIVTEAAHIVGLKDIWEGDIYPTLFDYRGDALFESSPNGYNHFQALHERGQDAEYPDWQSWQIPTSENPIIAPAEIAQAKATMDEGNFRQEILAQFVTRAGAVFPMFRRELHVTDAADYDPALPIQIGIDFGFRTFAAGLWQITQQGEARCFDEYIGKEEITSRALDGIAGLPYGNGKPFAHSIETIGCDPAGAARNVQTKRSDVQLLREAFPFARVKHTTKPELRDVEAGAGKIRAMLLSADGKTRLFVHPRCRHHIRMFENLAYPKHKEGTEEKAAPVKDGIHDHWFDETRYVLANTLWRGKQDLPFLP